MTWQRTEDAARTPEGRWSTDEAIYLAISAGVVLVITLVNTFTVSHDLARVGRPLPLAEPFIWEASSALVILAMTPAVVALTRKVWPLDRRWARSLLVHLAGAALFSVAHVLGIGAIRAAVYAAFASRYDAFAPLRDFAYEFRKDVLVYASLVAIYVAWKLLRARHAPAPVSPGVLEVRDGARRHFVPLSEVVWVEAAGNYVELHRGPSSVLHRASLTEMERRLNDAGFVRIHRSRLVRRDAIAAVESKPAGDYVVRLRDGRELAGSRRYRRPLLAD